MKNYEGETCESCLLLCGGKCMSDNNGTATSRPSRRSFDGACKHITPSLECRKVRALERRYKLEAVKLKEMVVHNDLLASIVRYMQR